MIVRQVAPNLRTCVVRSASLGVEQSLLGHFGNVHVSEFGRLILVQEYVGTLEITVENLHLMERLESSHNLDEDLPYLILWNVLLLLLVRGDLLEQVSVVRVLHHNTTTY